MFRILSLVAVLGAFALSMAGCRAEVEPVHTTHIGAAQ